MSNSRVGQVPLWIEFFGASGTGKTERVQSLMGADLAPVLAELGMPVRIVWVLSGVGRWSRVRKIVKTLACDRGATKAGLALFLSLQEFGLKQSRILRLASQYLFLRSFLHSGGSKEKLVHVCDQGYFQLLVSALSSLQHQTGVDFFNAGLPHRLFFPPGLDILPIFSGQDSRIPAIDVNKGSDFRLRQNDACVQISAKLGLAAYENSDDLISQLRNARENGFPDAESLKSAD